MKPLPEAVTAMLRLQGSIQKLLVAAFKEQSRRKLLQALLLDPTVHSYRNAVALINEMCELQKDILPTLEW
jgi:alpha-galactosidase